MSPHWIDWRAAFLVMGVAGILLAPVMLLLRAATCRAPSAPRRPMPLRSCPFSIIARKPTFWLMAFAASCSSLCGYGLALWTPSVLMRSFGLDLVEPRHFFASLLLIGGRRACCGRLAGGPAGDRPTALVRAVAGDRLADHRADLRDRPVGPSLSSPGRCCWSPMRSTSCGWDR